MPSFFGHAAAGIALGGAFADERIPYRTWALAAFCATAPDLDWFTVFLRIHPGNFLAHRGITHSLLGAVLLAAFVLRLGFRREHRNLRHGTCLLLAALSHGLLDACTSGRVGVAFFYPLSTTRWGCYWQPFQDAPLPFWSGLQLPFLGALLDEVFWIGVPAFLLLAGLPLFRQFADWLVPPKVGWPIIPEVEPEG